MIFHGSKYPARTYGSTDPTGTTNHTILLNIAIAEVSKQTIREKDRTYSYKLTVLAIASCSKQMLEILRTLFSCNAAFKCRLFTEDDFSLENITTELWWLMSLSFRRASLLCLKTVIWRCWSGRLQLRKDCQTFPYILNLITCPETHTVELSFILSLLSDVTGFRKLYNPVEHYKRLLYSYVLQVLFIVKYLNLL